MGPTRKLTELDARLIEDVLVFDCPCDRCKDIRDNPEAERNKMLCDARIRIPITPRSNGWTRVSGEFPETLTLAPSIRIGDPSQDKRGGCEGWHGHLINGVLVACE
jgi:hypothetical protein